MAKKKSVSVGGLGRFMLTGKRGDIPIAFVKEEDDTRGWILDSEIESSDVVLRRAFAKPLDVETKKLLKVM